MCMVESMNKAQQLSQYLKEVRIETRKVIFPKKKETLATTAAVIVLVFLIGSYLGLVDMLLSWLVGLVLK